MNMKVMVMVLGTRKGKGFLISKNMNMTVGIISSRRGQISKSLMSLVPRKLRLITVCKKKPNKSFERCESLT